MRPLDGEQSTTPCRVCRELIQLGAQVCTHCNSQQDWTRHLFRWKDILVTVLALVPLWSAAVSLHRLAFEPSIPKIQAVVLACSRDKISVAVANVGSAASVLGPPKLVIIRAGSSSKMSAYMLVQDGTEGVAASVLDAGKTASLQLAPQLQGTKALLPAGTASGRDCAYEVQFPYRSFDGRAGTTSDRCHCPEAS